MDNEMIERVAKAIDLSFQPPEQKDYEILMKNLAIAAIKAMREPTDKMLIEMETIEPSLECFFDKEKSPSYKVWQAAIDAILND